MQKENNNCTDIEHGPRSVVFYHRIKHDSFLSLCIGENHGIVLEFEIINRKVAHLCKYPIKNDLRN